MQKKTPLVELQHIDKAFTKEGRQELLVLKEINFKLHENEIVALLGKSGSGKSTLLRIISGLIPPTRGEAFYQGKQVNRPVQGISMIFQNFALMPWLTVLQNVELGLEAQGIQRKQRRERALKAIDTIGLDGFESAYPRELSGGMRQRVGFARALVVNPDLLLMDEPFSALDVLTSENLLSDLQDLWLERKTNIKGILFVTHDIEDAVWLADRIIIFGSDPGYIRAELDIKLPRPRSDQDPEFAELVDQIYMLMTTEPGEEGQKEYKPKIINMGYRLPDIPVSELSGLLELLVEEYQGKCDLPELADAVHLDIDNLIPLTDAMEILGFARTQRGDLVITPIGRNFADADILKKKEIFKTQLLKNIPLARRIRRVLDERPGHWAVKTRFLNELEDFLSEEEADRVLATAIDWGRYAEIFAYDNNSETLSLENP
ncbi:MAG: nitrate/sulfonate/bicarbonate ABC transporter ATP-binding protein [Pseudomonadota bacterium]